MGKLALDLHDIFDDGDAIEAELERVIRRAADKGIREVEIIHGKGSGALKKRVDRFLLQPEIKALYHRVKHDPKNHGRLFVYFK